MNILKKNKRGFTLIELLVVIAIIGILASVVLASLNTARKKARDSRRIADLKQIQLALELFYDACVGTPAGSCEYPDTIAALVPNYIGVEPKDPSTNESYAYDNLLSSAGTACAVADANTACVYYHLGGTLEEVTNPALKADADKDAFGTVDGVSTAAACAADAAATTATDLCYDLIP